LTAGVQDTVVQTFYIILKEGLKGGKVASLRRHVSLGFK
jgi:hypothetical protein